MEYFIFDDPAYGADVRVSIYSGEEGAEELHLIISPNVEGTFEEQLKAVELAYGLAQKQLNLNENNAVFRRFFVSDCKEQCPYLEASPIANISADSEAVAVSIVEQAPLPDQKIALWAYHLKDQAPLLKEQQGCSTLVTRPGIKQVWSCGLMASSEAELTSAEQTEAVFKQYLDELDRVPVKMTDEVLRTWIFVRDIDNNYKGMADARRRLFRAHGLTEETHFIASTGIEGAGSDPDSLILMDTYAAAGIEPEQICFLKAAEMLSPTSLYGVTFERGVSIDYGDRRHVFVSGTASIDKKGETLFVGQIERQIERSFDNVEALLKEGGVTVGDIAQMIVYLRNDEDCEFCRSYINERYPRLPYIMVRGAVCRQEWLVEAECLAIVPQSDPRWKRY